ncbi:LamG-like jellyroll fold domain-containing protein, partial [Candidatus Cloacimonadota bacterium]
ENIYNYAVVPASPSLELNSSFTLEAFTQPLDYGMNPNFGFGRIFDKGCIEVFLCNYFPLYNSESIVVKMEHEDGSISCISSAENSLLIPGGRHIAVSFNDNNELRIYINAIEQELTVYDSITGGLVENLNLDLYIGNSSEINNSFAGVIDEVRIWDRALSGTEINTGLDHYLNGDEADLKAYWRFNEGCGNIFFDLTANLNNGELTECTWTQGNPFDLTESPENILPDVAEIVLKAYPNPFNPSTTISFTLNTEITESTELVIYNIKGQKIKDLSSEATSAVILSGVEGDNRNNYSVTWNGTDENNQRVSSGIYLYKLSVGGKFVASKKGMLLK